MQTGQPLRQALVVSAQASKTRQPAEASFLHPALGPQYEALFCLRQFDDLKLNALHQGVSARTIQSSALNPSQIVLALRRAWVNKCQIGRCKALFLVGDITGILASVSPSDQSGANTIDFIIRSRYFGNRLMWKSGVAIAAIAFGASVGALLRWQLGERLNALSSTIMPGTLSANLIGAYVIGVCIAFFATCPTISPVWRMLLVTGFCGGLTTFSIFSAEVVVLLGVGGHLAAFHSYLTM